MDNSKKLIIDRIIFWREFRAAFYPDGGLQQETVNALNFILGQIENDGLAFYGTIEAIAYCLATWKHESRKSYKRGDKIVWIEFAPTRERRASPSKQARLYRSQERYFKTGHQGGGIVQLTWPDNYFRLGEHKGIKTTLVKQDGQDFIITGETLRANPSLILDPLLSYKVAAYGMRDGLFRPPNNLVDYFRQGQPPRYDAARDIVNGGRDKSALIALYAAKFERILRAATAKVLSPEERKFVELQMVREYLSDVEVSNAPLEEIDPATAAQIDPDLDLYGGEPTAPPLPETMPQRTQLKGYVAALVGFILTNGAAIIAYLQDVPPYVLVALICSGAFVTAVVSISVVWIKNNREARAYQKDLQLIKIKADSGEL